MNILSVILTNIQCDVSRMSFFISFFFKKIMRDNNSMKKRQSPFYMDKLFVHQTIRI